MCNPYESPSEVGEGVPDARLPSALPPDVVRGRRFVLVLIVGNTLLALSVIGIAVATGAFDRLPRLLFRLAVNIGLMYGLWRGTRWIKWLFALGLFLSGLILACVSARLPAEWFLLTAPFSALLIWAAWYLALGKAVRSFLSFQRGESVVETPSPDPDCSVEPPGSGGDSP